MSLNRPQILAFTVASALTAACWMWMDPTPSAPPSASATPAPASPAAWTAEDLGRVTLALETATSPEAQLDAALALRNIPPQDFPAVLERVTLSKQRQLTLAAKALLIQWASHDGEAAAQWAWQRFREEGLWKSAFREIGAAWAWKDPAGLAAWVAARVETKPDRMSDATLDEVRSSDSPVLEFGDITRVCTWLMPENPRLALELFEKRGGMATDDHLLWDALQDPRKIEDAILAFKDLDDLLKDAKPGEVFFGGRKGSAVALLIRWQTIDREGFARSAYARYLPAHPSEKIAETVAVWRKSPPADQVAAATHLIETSPEPARPAAVRQASTFWVESAPAACRDWLDGLPPDLRAAGAAPFTSARAAADLNPTLDWLEQFPPAIRHGCLVHAFDAWTAAHPDEKPDTSGWSKERCLAWDDLQVLKSIGTR